MWLPPSIAWSVVWIALAIMPLASGADEVIISEFMADNRVTLADEDGSFSDWIELYNATTQSVNLEGWFLTDRPDQLAQWRFPPTNIAGGAFLVVFASGKDRAVPGAPLHTSFGLARDGEFLALVKPDGVTIASQYAPGFPSQFPDASFGLAMDATPIALVSSGATARILVPTNDSAGLSWTGGPFADESWLAGTSEVGFEQGPNLPGSFALGGYWPFDDRSTDSTSNHPPALLSGPTYTNLVPPAIGSGRSLYLDGNNDFVSLGDVGMSSGTLSLWIRAADVGAGLGNRRLLSHVSGGVNQAGSLGIDPNGNMGVGSLWIWDGSRWLRLCADNVLRAHQWHYLALVADAGRVAFYLDGVKQNEVACGFGFSGPSMVLGAPFLNSYGNHFSGLIDDISIWSTPLTESALASLATGTTPLDLGSYRPFIRTDLASMWGLNSSVYLRIPFAVIEANPLSNLLLRMRYDDGFVAWLNGVKVADRNAPTSLSWNSTATSVRPAQQAIAFEDIDLTAERHLLHAGTNLLAIQGLNVTQTDVDLLIAPELWARAAPALGTVGRYFTLGTPGQANGLVDSDVGPSVTDVAHAPRLPGPADDIVVTARVAATFRPVLEVTLRYRVMFGPETSSVMWDDGLHADGLAGDSIFGATLPAGAVSPGRLLRYYVIALDTAGREARWPLFNKPVDSPAYLGTVVVDPGVVSALPVLHWFVEEEAAADRRAGTRASLFFLGEFYDNIFVRTRGAASSGFPKPSHKFDFSPGYHFRYQLGTPRVEEFNLITTYSDASYLREMLAYQTYRQAGAPASEAFMLRVQRNGAFYSVDTFVEQPDEQFLAAHDLDPQGALYKMYNALEDPVRRSYSFYTSDNDKRTRQWEDFSDLARLVAGVSPTNSPVARRQYLFDEVNLPAMINYLAATVVMQDLDHETHNYYAYRDSEGSGEWFFLPWDRNYSFGVGNPPNADPGSHPLLGSSEHIYPPWQFLEGRDVQWNHLTDAIYDTPVTRQMFLRRLRTLMDQLLQPPGTPEADLRFSQRLSELVVQMQSDVALDSARWAGANFVGGVNQLRSFLATRRTHLYVTHNVTNIGRYPDAAGIPPAQEGTPSIQFGVLEAQPESGIQDEEYIELVNSNPIAVDISGWRLSGAVRHTFQPGVVIPAGGSLYVSPRVSAFRARATGPSGGQGLFVQGNYEGHLSNLGELIGLVSVDNSLVTTAVTPNAPSPAQQFLRITEMMYHPPDPPPGGPYQDNDFEFVELKNLGTTPLILDGVRFSAGIGFSFTNATLSGGEYIVLVKNRAAFLTRYDPRCVAVVGEFTGSLDNGGELLKLDDAQGRAILSFTYDDAWQASTDGGGRSLVVRNPAQAREKWGRADGWRPSADFAGSPGRDDFAPPLADLDGDSLPDAWEQAQGGDLTATGDLDQDGLSNLEEFVAGTDPVDEASGLVVSVSASQQTTVISFLARATGGTGYADWLRYYALEFCPTLDGSNWSGVDGLGQVRGEGQVVRYMVSDGTAVSGFYRVRVWLDCP